MQSNAASGEAEASRGYTVYRAEYFHPFGEAILVVVMRPAEGGNFGLWEWHLLLPDHGEDWIHGEHLWHGVHLVGLGWDRAFAEAQAHEAARRALFQALAADAPGSWQVSEFKQVTRGVFAALRLRGRATGSLRRLQEKASSPELREDIRRAWEGGSDAPEVITYGAG